MVVSCVGWAVWDAFRNITALVFLEDWQLKSRLMHNISEMNHNTVCSAQNRLVTQSGVCHMYYTGPENIITWQVVIHMLFMGNK